MEYRELSGVEIALCLVLAISAFLSASYILSIKIKEARRRKANVKPKI